MDWFFELDFLRASSRYFFAHFQRFSLFSALDSSIATSGTHQGVRLLSVERGVERGVSFGEISTRSGVENTEKAVARLLVLIL